MKSLLNCRSHFSLGESLLTPTEIVAEAKRCGAESVALTDTMRISGMAELFTAAKDAGITPIIGARLRIVDELFMDRDGKKKHKPYFLRVIVRQEAAYGALLKLLSRSFDDDHFYEVPRLLLRDVCDMLGTAALGDAAPMASLVTLGDFYGAHSAGNAREVALALRAAGINVVSEIVPIDTPHFQRLAHEAFKLHDEEQVAVMVATPSFYTTPDHADALDVLRAISANLKMDERSTRHVHRAFTTQARADFGKALIGLSRSMMRRYPGTDWTTKLVEVTKNTESFAGSVTFRWDKAAPSLPVMAADEFAAVRDACLKGWKERFAAPVFGHQPTDLKPYAERLRYELGVLKALKFESYFLLVAEIVTWSKAQGIRVGPGRGSVGGSLVAYLMGITDIDPIRFGLIFERFINPDRIDLPDADLDFMSTRRPEIITEIKRKYGDAYVAGVSNYTTMAAAGALNDICRTLQFDTDIAFSKYVPKENGNSLSLEESITTVPELERFAKDNPGIIALARPIEDRMRSYGTHAAGVVVGGVPLAERAVVERRKGEAVVNWDKTLVEDFGLVKIDILGLSTLDMMDVTLKQIFKNHTRRLDPKDIPLDDAKVLAAFDRGETVGVFQFESHGMRRLLRDMAKVTPLSFEDITAATALYRPGPMDSGLMEQFVKIKKGEIAASYPHPSMEESLAETHGVMVYQEQVMRVCRDFAGFTATEADHLRKIMGKKLPEKMKEWRGKFVEGAQETSGVTEGFATEIFEQIAKFAGYGFNKSHASAYTLISYICMWLKVNYPAEFFCGLLTFVKPERREAALRDMKRLGLKLLPPDINESSDAFECLHATAILAPFNCLKGISDNTTGAILAARAGGRFRDKADFAKRVEARKCNIRHKDILDRVGAFSRIDPTAMPADHPDRRRDQVELMPNLVSDHVIIEREITLDKFKVTELEETIEGYRACDRCELKGLCHPKPFAKGPPKMMVIMDGPNYKDEATDEMGHGSYMDTLHDAMDSAGFTASDIYLTAFIKSPKPEATKAWSSKTITECSAWLDREIDIIRPPLIVVLGSLAARHFTDDLKGGLNEHVGRVIYDKKRDMNILLGFHPGQVFFDPAKLTLLEEVFSKAVTLLNL